MISPSPLFPLQTTPFRLHLFSVRNFFGGGAVHIGAYLRSSSSLHSAVQGHMADRRSPIPFGSPSLLDGVVQEIQVLHSFVILGHNGTFYIPFIPLSFRPFLLPILNPTLALQPPAGREVFYFVFSKFSSIIIIKTEENTNGEKRVSFKY